MAATARDHAFLFGTWAFFHLISLWHLFGVETIAEAFNQSNLDKPLNNNMLPEVVDVGDSNRELQLQADEQGAVIWKLSNVRMLAMQDTGDLHASEVVGSNSDTSSNTSTSSTTTSTNVTTTNTSSSTNTSSRSSNSPATTKNQSDGAGAPGPDSSSTTTGLATLNQSGAAVPDSSTSNRSAAIKLSTSPQRKKIVILLIIVVPATFATSILIIVVCLVHARRQRHHRNIRKQAEMDAERMRKISPLVASRFSYKDLCNATSNFKTLLGAGAFGSVYEGWLPDKRKAAVKRLASTYLMEGQFLAEIASIGRTNHVNVVSLIGFCCEGPHHLLVYEYVERGSLDKWLFLKEAGEGGTDARSTRIAPAPLLDWQTRYNVALGIARGLAYLHEECRNPVLHLDIKPQNILLDNDFTAKLADFGISRLMRRGFSQAETQEAKGTPGYIAPEFFYRKIMGKKCDIYSMGMVMLEIVGGRRNADLTFSSSAFKHSAQTPVAWHFFSWVSKSREEGGGSGSGSGSGSTEGSHGTLMELVDERLRVSCDMEQVQRLIHAALWCIQGNAKRRPLASKVVQWLEGRCRVPYPPLLDQCSTSSTVHPT